MASPRIINTMLRIDLFSLLCYNPYGGDDGMYTFLSNLLSDKKGGEIFTCFGIWHICFIALFLFVGIFLCLYLKNNSNEKQERIIDKVISIAFGLYIADFFLMPFAYGEIDIEKLPFHVCTAMCVGCFFTRRVTFLKKYKIQFAMLGFVSNLIYLIYPAGVMWHAVHPFSYRVIQTLSFHGIMMVYGLLVLIYETENFTWKKCYRDFFVILSMVTWALLGNLLYNSESREYNWFFVVRDPFNMFSESIARFIMPVLNIVIFFSVELLIYFIFSKFRRLFNDKK